MKKIVPFDYGEYEVRVVTLDNGEPGIVAMDIARVLGIRNVTHITENLDDDEYLDYVLRISGQKRSVKVLTEPGLYTVLIRSRKPEAKPFRRWVTHEVIPAVRRYGYYAQLKPYREELKAYEARIRDMASVRYQVTDDLVKVSWQLGFLCNAMTPLLCETLSENSVCGFQEILWDIQARIEASEKLLRKHIG